MLKPVVVYVVIMALLYWLSGCASVPTTTTATVPVPVSCVVKRPEKPGVYSDEEIKRMDDYKAVYALRRDRKLQEKYVGELEDVVDTCERAPSVVSEAP